MSVYFHANFNLNTERLSKVLKYLIEEPNLNDDQIASKFGYKAPFTKRYKSWLKKCGILENSTKVKLTDYGEVIFKKDPNLKQNLTRWFMHSELTNSEENAEAWNFVYHSYLPKKKSFSKQEISDAIAMKLMPHDPGHFGKNAPMIKVITKVLIESYTSDLAFGPLQIVSSKNGQFETNSIKCPYKWSGPSNMIKLY